MKRWKHSDFADWLRGTKVPEAQTMEGWEKWRKEVKEAHPFRYFLVEDVMPEIERIVKLPYTTYRDIVYYLDNRFIRRSNALITKEVKTGEWMDLAERLLCCPFDALASFVEEEKAWMWAICNKEDMPKINRVKKMFWKSEELGLKYLRWEQTLTKECPQQAAKAAEIEDLYLWWKYGRPSRANVNDLYPWWDCENAKDKEVIRLKYYNLCDQYTQEDEANLIRLIKIREGLWT